MMSNKAVSILWFCLLTFGLSLETPARAEDNQSILTFCRFGPKSKVFSPTHDSGNAEAEPSCEGSAKIQALMWSCTPKEAVTDEVDKFKGKLIEVGQAECTKHCEARGSHCKGKFIAPSQCGLKTNEEEARTMGKEEGCRSSCAGTSFAYCSIYDAEYRIGTADLLAKQKPNCICSSTPSAQK